ncbi:30S ribosomal protein S18 [Candidatus Mycoplasma pogonae]
MKFVKKTKKKNSRKKPCNFCVNKMDYIDYKNVDLLSKLINLHGKILSSRITGTCARHQRLVSTSIKRARFVAFLPFVADRIKK